MHHIIPSHPLFSQSLPFSCLGEQSVLTTGNSNLTNDFIFHLTPSCSADYRLKRKKDMPEEELQALEEEELVKRKALGLVSHLNATFPLAFHSQSIVTRSLNPSDNQL